MIDRKQTEVETKETLSYEERMELFELGSRYYFDEQYHQAREELKKVYDEKLTPDDINARAAFWIGVCNMKSLLSYNDAIDWFNRSIDQGSSEAAYTLGEIYENGIEYHKYWHDNGFRSINRLYQSDKLAFQYYLQSANMGHPDGMFKSSEFYRSGKMVIRKYPEAFNWMLKAACYKRKYCACLSDYFKIGVGVHENYDEAYIWAFLAGSHYEEETFNKLERRLPWKKRKAGQKEAEKRLQISEDFENPDALYQYMTQVVLPKIFENQKLVDETQPQAEAASSLPQDSRSTSVHEEPEPKHSSGIKYKYMHYYADSFDREKVKLKLIINTEIEKGKLMDFDRMIITYDNTSPDKKLKNVLNKIDVNRGERNLLVTLALQFSSDSKEQRLENIKKVLKSDKAKFSTNLNGMFRAMFDCPINDIPSSMINRENGELYPTLEVDTTKLFNAADYESFKP